MSDNQENKEPETIRTIITEVARMPKNGQFVDEGYKGQKPRDERPPLFNPTMVTQDNSDRQEKSMSGIQPRKKRPPLDSNGGGNNKGESSNNDGGNSSGDSSDSTSNNK